MLDTAETYYGPVSLAVVADGMGGLQKGELASAEVVRALDQWFQNDFPNMISHDISSSSIFDSWRTILENMNSRLTRFGQKSGVNIGTTVAILLNIADRYYFMNVGDSRIYLVTDEDTQIITKDHTLVMHEVEQGRLRPDQVETDARRNVLLQCIGASPVINPYYAEGRIQKDSVFVLCSDGFRHVISTGEIHAAMRPCVQNGEQDMERHLRSLIDLDMQRGENDNITAVAVLVRS